MSLVYNKGFNDLKGVDYRSKMYKTWENMLARCYSQQFQEKHPSYIGCYVCDDWLTFSKFRAWMESQDFEGKQLDKDLLASENKLYSPETCVFISQELNKFLVERDNGRGSYPIGVSFHKASNKFMSYCRENGKRIYLGLFDSSEEAHQQWLKKKLELAYIHASRELDQRIAKAIIERYENYQ